MRLSDPAQYQEIVDAEWNIIYAKLQACADSGAKIVLSRLAIGDLATQFFADRDIFCAGRARTCRVRLEIHACYMHQDTCPELLAYSVDVNVFI